MQRISTVALVVICCLANINSAFAGPRENEFGAGSVSSSLASAGVAYITNASATFINPANLSGCVRSNAEFGFRFISTQFNVSPTSGDRSIKQFGNLYAAEFGVCIVPIEDLGVGIWVSNDAIEPISLGVNTPKTDYYFSRFGAGLGAPTIVFGAGYAIWPEFSIGVSVTVSMHARITQDVYAPLNESEDNTTFFATDIGATVKPRIGGIIAFTIKPWDFLGVAASFRTANSGQLDVKAQTQAVFIIPIPPIRVEMESAFDYEPRQYTTGVFFQPTNWLTLVADLNYAAWSKFPGPFLKVYPDPGSAVSRGIPLPANLELSFRDVFIPRAGVEFNIAGAFTVRTGYEYHPAVVGLPSGKANLLDGDTHTIALGGGYKLDTETFGLKADFFFSTHIMPQHSVPKNATNEAYSFDGISYATGFNAGVEF